MGIAEEVDGFLDREITVRDDRYAPRTVSEPAAELLRTGKGPPVPPFLTGQKRSSLESILKILK
jgi:hypothetical protein